MSETIVSLHHVSLKQGKETILTDIDLSLTESEFVYLVGKTGSGKSTLLKALYAEVPLFTGEGSVAGFSLTSIKKRSIPYLRRSLGIVFQDFQLLMDRTVIQNMYFVLKATGWKNKSEVHKRAMSVLQLVGMEQKAAHLPGTLSGGEQQRVSIARALLNEPKVILADEPTGNLDAGTADEIMQLLVALSREEKTAVIIATHNLSLVEKYKGRILRVEDGKVKMAG
jgi:cell division transport system ATP-binding protein